MNVNRSFKTYLGKNGQTYRYEPQRDAKKAIEEKLVVLREFYVVDKRNEAEIRAQMEAELAKRPDVEFDRVLDNFAKRLIGEKLG